MSYLEFFAYFSNELVRNVAIIMVVGTGIFLLQRHRTYSIFDPYYFSYLMPITFCVSVIIILFIDEPKNTYRLLLSSNFIQIITIAFCLKKEKTFSLKIEQYDFFLIFFSLHTLLFLITIFVQFKNFFSTVFTNKLAMYSGHGVLVYFSGFIYSGELILLMEKKFFYKKNNVIFDKLLIALCFFTSIMSGSKASAVSFFINYFFVKYFIFKNYSISNKQQQSLYIQKQNKRNWIVILMLLPFVLITTMIVNGENKLSILPLLQRMVSYGDIYFLAFPQDLVEHLKGHYSYINSFLIPLISPLRKFIPGYQGDSVLGFDIIKAVYKIQNPTTGPNSRYDVMLLLSTPVLLNLITCFIFGSFYSFVRTKFFNSSKSFLGFYWKIAFMLDVGAIFTDFSLFASGIFGIIYITPIIYFISYIIYCSYKTKIRLFKIPTLYIE